MRNKKSVVESIKRNRHLLILIGIYVLGVALFVALIHIVIRVPGSDDFAFQTQIKPYHNVFSWIDWRYHTWSGRIFAEGFVYTFTTLPLKYWKIVTISLYMIFSAFTYLYYLLFTTERSNFKDYIMISTALAIPLLMDTGAILNGMLWSTGAMNYFWIAAFGLVSFYPFVYYVTRKKLPPLIFLIIGMISSIVAASSQEQLGMLILVLATIFTIYSIIQNKASKTKTSIPWFLLINLIIIAISLFISITSPGDRARIGSETITWRPDFFTIPLSLHIEYASRWFADAVVNHSGFLLIASWLLLVALFIKKNIKDKWDYIFIFLLSAASTLSLAKGYDAVNPWVTFYAIWNPAIPNHGLSLLVLLCWLVVIIVSIIAPLFLFRKNAKGKLLSVLFLGFICSILILTLSPTMYASGPRTLFVPAIVLIFIVYILLDVFITTYRRLYVLIFITALACLAVAQYLKLVQYLLSLR